MIDAARIEGRRQKIPMRDVVSRDDGSRLDTFLGDVDALGFAQKGACQSAAAALAQRDNDAPLARAVLR